MVKKREQNSAFEIEKAYRTNTDKPFFIIIKRVTLY